MRENKKEGGIYMVVEEHGENKRGRYMERTKEREERGGGRETRRKNREVEK